MKTFKKITGIFLMCLTMAILMCLDAIIPLWITLLGIITMLASAAGAMRLLFPEDFKEMVKNIKED